jgi:baseplate J-like protein
MQKCKQCEWEFPDDIRICPYCGHPVETEEQKQKRRFKLRRHPDTLLAGAKGRPSGLAPSQTTPSKKHPRLVLLVSTITAILLLGSTLIGFVWARGNLTRTSQPSPTVSIDQPPIVNPSLLDFGQVEVGNKPVLSVIIKKSNESRLKWHIVPANALWLQIALRPKANQSSNPREDVYDVTANTSKLSVGKYSALLLFSSERGSTQRVPIKMQVIPNRTPLPAKLNVNPLLLDFGAQNVRIQKTLLLTVSNSGGQELRWTADKGKILWLTLDHYSGKIAPGAIPQGINVKVDTTTLTAGHYSTSINFSSNGGYAPVAVLLIVTPARAESTVTPSPTPSPTLTPTPPPVQRQISSTQTQSQTVDATGSGQTDATTATGSLTFTNSLNDQYKFSADTIYVSKSEVQVKIYKNVSVPAKDSIIVPAYAVKAGAAGNIAAGDVNTCVSPSDPDGCTVTVKNDAPFTGGQDAQTYTFVQQSDIDGAATSLTNSTQQSAIDDIHQHLHPNEHLVGDPQCTSDTSSDHNAGDRVSQVTVTVTTTCKATAST